MQPFDTSQAVKNDIHALRSSFEDAFTEMHIFENKYHVLLKDLRDSLIRTHSIVNSRCAPLAHVIENKMYLTQVIDFSIDGFVTSAQIARAHRAWHKQDPTNNSLICGGLQISAFTYDDYFYNMHIVFQKFELDTLFETKDIEFDSSIRSRMMSVARSSNWVSYTKAGNTYKHWFTQDSRVVQSVAQDAAAHQAQPLWPNATELINHPLLNQVVATAYEDLLKEEDFPESSY